MEGVYVKPDAVPGYIFDGLAAGTLDLLHDIVAAPGGREALDRKKAELWPEKYGKKGTR